MSDQVFITHEDIAKIGYYFLDAEHERRFLRCINKELMGIITREEALRLKKRTLNSLKEKRLVILSGSVKQLETQGEKQTLTFRQKNSPGYSLTTNGNQTRKRRTLRSRQRKKR